ncbi:MAG: DUF2807 domain-containing protein [Caulobacter sp.]|nr:DUF2807 domain-containing protein [Caulobacter sp.]
MRMFLTFGVAAAALLAAGAAQAKDPSVRIKDAAARVVVIPENRTDVKVEVLTTNPGLPLTIRAEAGRTVVDGGLSSRAIRNCRTINGVASVTVRHKTYEWADLPQVVVRVPMNASIGADGAVFGSVGRTDSLELSNAGCGDWTVGNVGGALKIRIAGSGDTMAGSAGSAGINIAGSGDVQTGAIAGALDVSIAGSGDVEAASVTGDVSARIAGSGDVRVRGGKGGALNASIAGSGDVVFEGTVNSVSAKIAGSGDVRVAGVSGSVSKQVVGSGTVIVGAIGSDD